MVILPMRGDLAVLAEPKASTFVGACRPLVPSDVAALGRLMAAAYRGGVEDSGEPPQWHAAEADASFSGHYGHVIWAACFALCRPSVEGLLAASVVTQERHVLLAFLLVDPAWQGRGAGTYLIRRSAAALRREGRTEWTLAVADGNPARRLYERHGFVVDESLRTSP